MNEKNHRLDDFFEKYSDMVMKSVHKILKDYHIAEDISQETFVRLGENLDKLPDSKVKIWWLVTSKNLAYDYLRKGGKYTTIVGYDERLYQDETDEKTDPSVLVEKKEEENEKWTALHRLSVEKPEWYEVLMLSEVTGLSNEEIGQRFGISAVLVSKWKERARKWLNKAYREQEEEKRDS